MKFKANSPDSPDELIRKSIRDRIVPAAAMVGDRSVPETKSATQLESDYEKDLEKLRALKKDQLKELLNRVEEKSREGEGIFSRGDLLNGYAIDRKTLQSLQSSQHNGIDFDLMQEIIQNLAKIKDESTFTPPSAEEEWAIRRRIVKGMVYLQVPGFKIPIVKLFLGLKAFRDEVPKKDVLRIINYLKEERRLLPISSDLRAL